MIYNSELPYIKTWKLRRIATGKRKALTYARDPVHRVTMRDSMIESLEADLAEIEGELKRRTT